MDEFYENLWSAIIISAVNDYTRALKSLKKREGRASLEPYTETESVERFFRSKMFEQNMNVSGEFILQSIREKVDSGEMKSARIKYTKKDKER